jgi:hypothetical protein
VVVLMTVVTGGGELAWLMDVSALKPERPLSRWIHAFAVLCVGKGGGEVKVGTKHSIPC